MYVIENELIENYNDWQIVLHLIEENMIEIYGMINLIEKDN